MKICRLVGKIKLEKILYRVQHIAYVTVNVAIDKRLHLCTAFFRSQVGMHNTPELSSVNPCSNV